MAKTPADSAADSAPLNHRADAAQAFLAAWLPQYAVAAGAFTAEDAQALVAAIDAAAEAAGA